MKDSEFEAILKEALTDDRIPSEELNARLMKRIANKKKMRFFGFDVRYAAAAAVVIAAGGAALLSNNVFIRPGSVNELARETADTYGYSDSGNDSIGKYTDNAPYTEEKTQSEAKTDTTSEQSAAESITGSKQNNSTAKKNEAKPVMSDKDNSAQSSAKSRAESIIVSRPKSSDTAQKESTAPEAAQAAVTDLSGEKGTESNTLNKYIEIAAEGIGKALDSLNLTVNGYIGELYATHNAEMPAVSAARSYIAPAAGSAKQAQTESLDGIAGGSGGSAKKQPEIALDSDVAEDVAVKAEPQANNSYEVLCNSEKYYSVKINTEFEDEPGTLYTKTYTVDKKKEAVVTLDDVYSGKPGYKAELYDNICSQMERQMEQDKDIQYYIGYGFSEITGEEDFYINSAEEVVITFDAGTVSPYKQGESSFNVGSL